MLSYVFRIVKHGSGRRDGKATHILRQPYKAYPKKKEIKILTVKSRIKKREKKWRNSATCG